MNDSLKRSILNTVCYYDVLNYPLTVFEIWKHLLATDDLTQEELREIKIGDILENLDDPSLNRFIDNCKGMYFLKGRNCLVEERILHNKISILKMKKFKKAIKWIKFAPFVRMILITGKLAMKNAHLNSDWDVLIVLKEGRIWIGRTFITLWTHFLGKRRHHDKIRNRLCFNYFIATNSLEIKNKDLYSANEYFFCFPIFDKKNYFQRFQLKNSWIKNYKPNYYLNTSTNSRANKDGRLSIFLRSIFENLLDFDFLEKYLEKIETEKIKNNPKTKKVNSLVDIGKDALIFLPNPRGPKIFERFKNKMQEFRF